MPALGSVRGILIVALAGVIALAGQVASASDQSLDGGFIWGDGKGKEEHDCFIGLVGYSENDAVWQPINEKRTKFGVVCTECDPSCDLDAEQNGICEFAIGLFLQKSGHPVCAPESLTFKKAKAKAKAKGVRINLATELGVPMGQLEFVSSTVPFPVPLKGKKQNRTGKGTVTLSAKKPGDRDKFQFRCLPRPEGEPCPSSTTSTSTTTTSSTSTTATSSTTMTTLRFGCFLVLGDGMVRDTCEGLQWEQKNGDDGTPDLSNLHDVDNAYVWAGSCTVGGALCQPNQAASDTCYAQADLDTTGCAQCSAGTCDVDPLGVGAITTVWDWINQVNAEGPANNGDWRLPSEDGREPGVCVSCKAELETILDQTRGVCGGGSGACITPIFGPTAADFYWSATSDVARPNDAWVVPFGGGGVGGEAKNAAHFLRAVRRTFPSFDRTDVEVLADDALAGRDNMTEGSLMAQDFLIRQLERLAVGLDESQTGDDAFKQPFPLGTNILGLIRGSELPDEYVIVGAHYDHIAECQESEPGDLVCNGATDNAAGVAAALAIARAIDGLPNPPRRSVVLAFWDAEEDLLKGSEHYVANPIVPLASTTAYVNFDIQGANLLPSLENFSFAIGAETGGATLKAAVDAAIRGEGLDTRRLSFIFGQNRSDFVHFERAGVPIVFFTDASGPCYHTNQDEVAVVDFGKLEEQSKIAFNLTLALAQTDAPPTFVPPDVASPNLATFDDARVLEDVGNAGVANLNLFSESDQVRLLEIQSELNEIIDDGPGNFDSSDALTLLVNINEVVNRMLGTLDCDGFL